MNLFLLFVFLLISLVRPVLTAIVGDGRDFELETPSATFTQAGDYYWVDSRKIEILRAVDKFAVGPELGNGTRTLGEGSVRARALFETSPTPVDPANFEWSGPVFLNKDDDLEQVVTNEIIVKLKKGVRPGRFFEASTFPSYRRLRGTTDQFVAKVKERRSEETLKFANFLHEANDKVVWATPDFVGEVKEFMVPPDPLFDQQWQHLNYGQAVGLEQDSRGTPGADCSMVEAWDVVKGQRNLVLAVFDEGVQHSHPDLVMFRNPGEIAGDGVDNDNNGYVDDLYGWNFASDNNDSGVLDPLRDIHGTAVAGVAAAVSNSQGGVGSAFGARILSVKAMEAFTYSSSTLAEAIYYAAGRTRDGRGYWRGADVIIMSVGFPLDAAHLDAVEWAVSNGRGGLGVPLFVAAGHWEPRLTSLAKLSDTIAVGASNWTDKRADFSSYGNGLDFVAPGVAVPSTDITGIFGYNPGMEYKQDSGGEGLVSIEAETGYPVIDGGDRWNAIACEECSSGYAVEIGPDDGDFFNSVVSQAELLWDVNFTRTGTHFVWVRGYARDGASRSCFVGYDRKGSTAKQITLSKQRQWVWSRRAVSGMGTLDIPITGLHFVSVWMRDDGFRLDKLVLTSDPEYEPLDKGPSIPIQFDNSDYTYFTGTSAATPMAAGIGALLIATRPEITADEVRQTLRGTADKVGGVQYDSSGWHEEYGYGRINAHNALTWLAIPPLRRVDVGPTSHVGFYWPPENPGGAHHLESAGSGLAGSVEDGFNFAFMKVSGDYNVIVRVDDVTPHNKSGRKGGLMFRKSLASNSKYVGIFVGSQYVPLTSDPKIFIQHRTKRGANALIQDWPDDVPGGVVAPRWLKVEKRGDRFQGFNTQYDPHSKNIWEPVGEPMTVRFGKSFYVGLAGTAGSRTTSHSYFSYFAVRRIREDGGKYPGLVAEYFKLSEAPLLLPRLKKLVPDVVRTETVIHYPNSLSAWPGLGSQFTNAFASRHTGYIYTEIQGNFTFFLSSNDGSRLRLDGKRIIDNDGEHGMVTRQASRNLVPGYHSVNIRHFETRGRTGLILEWSGPNFDRRIVSPNSLFHHEKLKAHWRLDDTTGNEADDSTGHGFSAIVHFTEFLEPKDYWWSPDGVVGGSIQLNELDPYDYIEVQDIDIPHKAYGLSLWIRTESGGDLFMSGELNIISLRFRDGNIQARVYQDDKGSEYLSPSYNLLDNEWHHIVHTFGGREGGQKLYIDGELLAEGNLTYSNVNEDRSFKIGQWYRGGIDEIKLFDGALSQEEVTELFNEGQHSSVAAKMASGIHVERDHRSRVHGGENSQVDGRRANGES